MLFIRLTLEMLGTANELDPAEEGDSARKKHGERSQLQSSFLASVGSSCVPSTEGPTVALIVDVVEQTVFWHKQGVRLKRSF